MNRRLFMKSVGMTAIVGIAGLSFSTPVKTKYGGPYPHCSCETCKAGLPATSMHWKMIGPEFRILNDCAISRIRITDDSAGLSNKKTTILANDHREAISRSKDDKSNGRT